MRELVPAPPFAAIVEERISHLERDESISDPVSSVARQCEMSGRILKRVREGQEKISAGNADKIVTHILGPMAWYTEPELHEIYTAESDGTDEPPGPKHGTRSTYTRHKCRCDDCRAANIAYLRERERRLAAAE